MKELVNAINILSQNQNTHLPQQPMTPQDRQVHRPAGGAPRFLSFYEIPAEIQDRVKDQRGARGLDELKETCAYCGQKGHIWNSCQHAYLAVFGDLQNHPRANDSYPNNFQNRFQGSAPRQQPPPMAVPRPPPTTNTNQPQHPVVNLLGSTWCTHADQPPRARIEPPLTRGTSYRTLSGAVGREKYPDQALLLPRTHLTV